DLATALIARSAALWNMYGPTETTIWSLAQQIDAKQPRITIGRPIANTQIYLLDATLQPVPIGVPGQIMIGGDGLARGYLKRPELTAEKFIPDPFSQTSGSRLYQTGDLARYLPDGALEFLGRIDHQVKVRGYRIELGEIEAVLRQQPAVRDAVVVAREVAGDTRLVAYVVGEQKNKQTKEQRTENKEQSSTADLPSPIAMGEGPGVRASGEGLTTSALRAALRAQLPEYMIPSTIMVLDALPQTPNGKIDRKALPSPEGVRSELEAYVAPQTELETTIAAIWQELLGSERVGVHDNFFDLGGHSLLTAQVHSRLRATLGREISIVDLFKYPTIAALAQYLGQDQPAQPTFEQTLERVAAYRSAIRSEHASTDIAIVGMAGRFPGAANVEEFWRNISAGVESLKNFSDEELLAAGVDPALLDHPQYVRVGPALDGIELFDAAFFGYNPREAALLDPQQRLFLTSAYEALEHAGYDSQQFSGAIGVYAGAGMNTYLINNLLTNRQLAESVSDFQTMISNDKDFLTTRVSYLLNLRGPSVNMQSACSTSLVAVTLACQSLLNHQCDLALAGGVSLRVPQTGYLYQEEGIRSPDGHCRAFDASAQGTIFGSGVGVVVLKRLSDALTDGDTIHAVIKGAAINNDGAGKIGYTAPSVDGQAQVIAEALAVAGVDPATIDYVEAHGTGTALGDPIEIAALTEAFRATTDASGYCAIGSVKTNVGHLDTAAGVAGLIKTVQALKHQQLPPSLHFERPNPQIDFASSPFYVNSQLTAWPERERPRRAGVSALGIGGTNAHVIVEESPASTESEPGRPWQILLLSAKTATALETATTNLAEHLKQHPEQSLADVAYTLQLGRRSFNHRRVLVCRDRDDAKEALQSRDPQRVVTHVQEPGARNIAFMFPGGGAQYVNMAAELYAHEPVFKAAIDRCAELLRSHIDADLRDFLYPANASPEDTRRLEQPSLALPALFATEYALAQLWQAWGVKPTAMIGHSLGEYVAACLAGVISLADALALVTLRGQLFEQLPPGAMLSVPLPESDLLPLLGSDLSLAAINGPTLSVVSGPITAIEALAQTLAERGIETNRLHIDVAAHSAMLEPMLEPFGAFVRTITLSPPQTRFISNVTGTWIT
ncbi:MAG: acyltransferase domain-containing protein, partial [Chloroflexi bacterium]|nr:acyltransferase domain-containing protein [Chloroflexota bacterium]